MNIEVKPQNISVSINNTQETVVIIPQCVDAEAEASDLSVSTGLPIVREFIGGEPYSGEYVVIPKAEDAVVLPTTNKILYDDVTVTKVPYFETSNTSGTTVYIASEV